MKWNTNEIKQRQEYLLERLKNCTDPKEKEQIELSLVANISVLNNSGSLRYTKLYNIMDKITKNNFSLKRHAKYIQMERNRVFNNHSYKDNDYLGFLVTLAQNITKDVEDEVELKQFNISNEQMINISKDFYESLGMLQFHELSEKIFSEPDTINITKTGRSGFEEIEGVTYNDYIFKKSYINVTKKNTVSDLQTLNHEVMHGMDFYAHPKVPSQNYFGFHEIPTYTIDYLFLDYIETLGFDNNQINILRQRKENYLSTLAQLTLMQIKTNISRKDGYQSSINPSIEIINEAMTPDMMKQLIEIESGIISRGLKEQIDTDRKKGLSNVIEIMNHDMPSDKKPDFSFVGLNDISLLEISKRYNSINKSQNNKAISK